MPNRNGLAATEATLATGTAEREAAAAPSERLPKGPTLAAEKGYDAGAFVGDLKPRGLEPRTAINGTVSKAWQGAQDGQRDFSRPDAAWPPTTHGT